MKPLIFIIFSVFFINIYPETIKDEYGCAANGYPLDDIIKVEQTIQTALRTNDMTLLSEQFMYPFAVHLPQGSSIISNKQELINKFSSIYSKADVEQMVAQKNLIPFCRYDGAAIFGGMWLSTDKNQKIKVFVINANGNATLARDLPYGTPIMPISDLNLLKTFADMYQSSDHSIKVRGYQSLKVESKWSTEYRPNLVGGSFFSHDYAGFLLYRVDINNDHEPEWVLVYPSEGDMGTGGIEAVYRSKNQVLERISYDKVIISNFHLRDMSGWYLFIADPFFTLQKGKVVFNFYNGQPAQVCSYLWENDKVVLVHGDPAFCSGNRSAPLWK